MAQEWHNHQFYETKAAAERCAARLHKKGYQTKVVEVAYMKGKDGKGYYTAVKYDYWAGERVRG